MLLQSRSPWATRGRWCVDVVVDFVLFAVAQAVEVVCLIDNGAPEGALYNLCAESIVAVVLVGLAHGLL